MSSTPFIPYAAWAPGTNSNSVPANDNALRQEMLQRDVNNSTTAQPSLTSPADDGKTYIIQSTHTGAQWASFTPKDIAIFKGGSWYAFAPVEGLKISVGGVPYIYTAGAWTAQTGANQTMALCIACGDETTPITAGTAKVTFRMPFAFTLTGIRGSLTTAQASGANLVTVDVNESGTSVISTKLTFDNTEKTTTTAATPPVISDSSIADDAEMTIDIDLVQSGSVAAGLKVYLIGHIT